ncbi:hypothetical protein JCM8547_007801 [Rhodosporidiobolus lusitaniae]
MPSDDDGFTSVTYKPPSRSARCGRRGARAPPRERSIDEKLASREPALRVSGYLSACRELLRNALAPPPPDDSESIQDGQSPCPKPKCVVCLGLGSLSDSYKAQDQYILLKAVLEELGSVLDKETKVEFYDPAFSPEDTAFLTSQGHIVLSSNHPLLLPRPTLLYIPHGPRTLFDALLRANWTSPEQLRQVIVLGNRLDLYEDPTFSGVVRGGGIQAGGGKKGRRRGQEREEEKEKAGPDELGESAEWVVRAAKLFKIVPLPDSKEHLEAFNDLALEWVSPDRVEGKEAGFWRKEQGEVEATKVEEAIEGLEKLGLQ